MDGLKNQGAKETGCKARFDLIPPYPLWELAKAYNIGGGNKYHERSWEKGISYGSIIGALLRHVYKWIAGEKVDPEDGIHHLAHAAWCCFTLMEYQQTHMELDDRSSNKTLLNLMNSCEYKMTWGMEDFSGSKYKDEPWE